MVKFTVGGVATVATHTEKFLIFYGFSYENFYFSFLFEAPLLFGEFHTKPAAVDS